MRASEIKSELVWDWSRPEAATIQLGSTVEEAVARMTKLDIHHLIVMEGKTFRGILDARDLAGVWDPQEKLREYIRSDVPVVDEATEIRTVVEMLVDRRLTAVPLKRGQGIQGILTVTDMLRLLESELSGRSEVAGLIEKGKAFLTKPIVQGLTNLLERAGL